MRWLMLVVVAVWSAGCDRDASRAAYFAEQVPKDVQVWRDEQRGVTCYIYHPAWREGAGMSCVSDAQRVSR